MKTPWGAPLLTILVQWPSPNTDWTMLVLSMNTIHCERPLPSIPFWLQLHIFLDGFGSNVCEYFLYIQEGSRFLRWDCLQCVLNRKIAVSHEPYAIVKLCFLLGETMWHKLLWWWERKFSSGYRENGGKSSTEISLIPVIVLMLEVWITFQKPGISLVGIDAKLSTKSHTTIKSWHAVSHGPFLISKGFHNHDYGKKFRFVKFRRVCASWQKLSAFTSSPISSSTKEFSLTRLLPVAKYSDILTPYFLTSPTLLFKLFVEFRVKLYVTNKQDT